MSTERSKYVRSLCDYEPQAIEWLWPNRVAAGKVTLIDGTLRARSRNTIVLVGSTRPQVAGQA
jgi:hypothetical protein